jgi:hypothetical protein
VETAIDDRRGTKRDEGNVDPCCVCCVAPDPSGRSRSARWDRTRACMHGPSQCDTVYSARLISGKLISARNRISSV